MEKCTAASRDVFACATAPSREDASGMRISLRASIPTDWDFLKRVFESTRTDEFRAAGLDAQTIRDLLDQQFSMQDAYYRRHYSNGRFDIVLIGDKEIGRLYHDWNSGSGEARVIDIALLPSWRGAGIGTRLMKAVVAEAARRAMAVGLYVEFNNPVRALYRRLGFEGIGENGIYEQMCRPVGPLDDADIEPIVGLAAGIKN
jgi:ribosomal protein S18 acetylase RimI-like enzyme